MYVQMQEAPGKLPRRRLQFVILCIYPDTPGPFFCIIPLEKYALGTVLS